MNATEIVFIPSPVSVYRQHQENITNQPGNDAALRAYFLLKKYLGSCERTALVSNYLERKAPLALLQACSLNQTSIAKTVYEDIYFRRNFPSVIFFKATLMYLIEHMKGYAIFR